VNKNNARAIQKQEEQYPSPLETGAGLLAGATAATIGGWILYSHVAIDHNVPLPDAIPAERQAFESERAGQLSYYVDLHASGRPLVLIHSVNAAASAYEMRPLFEYYRSIRPVFALDLPGYGFSERSARRYTPALFTDAILAVLERLNQPADVIGVSLGSEFIARAALAHPELFHSLTMISPSGFNRATTGRASQRIKGSAKGRTVHGLLSFPIWRRPLFDLIATRRSIRFFLKQSFVGPVTPGFVDYAYATAHQPGAEHAPLYFLSGLLFTPNVRTQVYQNVETPTLVLHDEDAYVTFEQLPDLLEKNSNWRTERITPTRGLPHFEKLPETTQALDDFWADLQ
jgi:pimeloyl-ACP methyl ester carboxylesterase